MKNQRVGRTAGTWALAAALALTGLVGIASAQPAPDAGTGDSSSPAGPPPDGASAGPPDRPFEGSGGPRERFRDFRDFQEFQEFRQFERWQAFERWQRGRFRQAAGPEALLIGPMLFAFRRLDLSDAQRQQVRRLLNDARQQRAQRAPGQPDAATAQTRDLLDPGSPGHAAALQSAKDRAVARIQQASELQQRLYQLLNDQQKTQLRQLLAQRRFGAQRGAEGNSPTWHPEAHIRP
jgi:Spy/CpxP family protein refolding chaperone